MIARPSTAGVIATYNQSPFIAEAIASLIDQVDELIVVDDASTDSTRWIVGSVDHPKLRVIRHETQAGVSRSFNDAVDATSAEIVVIQGGDDRSVPDRVQRQVRTLEDSGTVLCASVPAIINRSGAVMPEWTATEFSRPELDGDYLGYLFSVANMICAPSVAVRRSDFVDLGAFHVGLDHLQDHLLWLRFAAHGRFVILADPVVEYRKHTNNLSRANVGIDSPQQRRQRAEKEFLLSEFLEHADAPTLVRLAQSSALDTVLFAELARDEQVALLQLNHPDRLLVRRGLAFLFSRLGHADGERGLARMGVTMTDIGRFAVRADHDNAGDVSRALAVRAAYGSPS